MRLSKIALKMFISGLLIMYQSGSAASIKPVITQGGDLAYIEVQIDGTAFRVTATGKIASIDPPTNTRSSETHQRINNIAVIYDRCRLNTSSNPYQSPKTQQLNQALRAFAAASSCPNQNGTLGKVLQIGDYRFSYYQSTNFNSLSRNNPESGSVNKIKTAGPYRFTYYPLDTFGNKGGKVSNIIGSE